MDNIINGLKQSNKSNSSKVYKYVLMAFIFCIIIQHILQLTSFTFKYNSYYDYGKMLKKVCHKEYFESETHRTEIAENEEDIKNNQFYNKQIYLMFVLVISVIMSIFVSVVLAMLIFNLFYNYKYIAFFITNKKDTNKDSLFQILKKLINPFGYVKELILMSPAFFANPTAARMLIYIVILFVFYMLTYIIAIYPYTFYAKLATLGGDSFAKMFAEIPEDKIPVPLIWIKNILKYKINKNIENAGKSEDINIDVILGILICMRMIYFFIGNDEDDFTNYFKESIPYHILSNDITGLVLFIVVLLFYKFAFQNLNDIITFYDNINTIHSAGKSYSPFQFLKTMWGFGDKSSALSIAIFKLIIVLLLITGVFSIASYFDSDTEKNYEFINYYVFIPLLSYIVILIIFNNVIEYDNQVEKNILTSPLKQYKTHINVVNKLFNKELDKEYNKIVVKDKPKNICKNVGNTILNILYSDLFKNIETYSMGLNIQTDNINITPEFEYNGYCETTIRYDFESDKKYDIKYYLNQKSRKKSIFYYSNKCSEVNTNIQNLIIENAKAYDREKINNALYAGIFNVLNNNLYYDNSSGIVQGNHNINNKLTHLSKIEALEQDKDKNFIINSYGIIIDKILDIYENYLIDKISQNTFKANILFNKLTKNEDDIKDVLSSIIELFNTDTKIKTFINNDLEFSNTDVNFSNKNSIKHNININVINNLISKKYNFNKTLNSSLTKKSLNLDLEYIKKVNKLIKEREEILQSIKDENIVDELEERIVKTFSDINGVLTNTNIPKQNGKLTKYIISNYNNINKTAIYDKDLFDVLNIENTKYSNVKKVDSYIDNLLQLLNVLSNHNKVQRDDSKDENVMKTYQKGFEDKIESYKLLINEIEGHKKNIVDILEIDEKDIFKFSNKNLTYILTSIEDCYNSSDKCTNDIDNAIGESIAASKYIKNKIEKYQKDYEDIIEVDMSRDIALGITKNANDTNYAIYTVAINYIILMSIVYFII